MARYVGHFTTYALDGGTGKIRWKHEPGDFEKKQESNEVRLQNFISIIDKTFEWESSSYTAGCIEIQLQEFVLLCLKEQESLHFKLRLKTKSLHRGEVHWKKYSHSFINQLPFSWAHSTDTSITLGEFERSFSQPDKTTERNIAEQLMTLAKSGISTSPKQKSENLNSVVIRHCRGMEVLNLDKGSPVCSLPLDSRHSTLADVNADGHVDLVKLNVVQENSKSECFLVASDALVSSSVLFNSSACHPSRVGNILGEFRVCFTLDQTG